MVGAQLRAIAGLRMMLKRLFFFVTIFATSLGVFATDNIARLRGDHLYYNQDLEQLVASGNASLIHPDFEVYGNSIIVNTELETVDGIGDIYINKDDQKITSDRFHLDLNTKHMSFDHLNLVIEATNKTDKIFISADQFFESDAHKSGLNGFLTTCDFKTPHYYMRARSFKLYPEDRLIAHYVLIKAPIWFIPFWMPMPAYIYELGKRRVVYLWPKFGQNNTEGTWFKSQFDYYFAEDNWGSAYVDYMSNFGVGLGARHHYKALPPGYGKAFSSSSNDTNYVEYYSILNHDFENIRWNQTTDITPSVQTQHDIQTYKRPGGNGSFAREDRQAVNIVLDPVGDTSSDYSKLDVSHSSQGSTQSNSDTLVVSLSDHYQNNKQWDFYGKRHKTTQGLKQDTFKLGESHKIWGNINMSTNMDYYRYQKLQDTDEKLLDQDLNVKQTFSKTFDGQIQSVAMNLDLVYDPDANEFTDDDESTWTETRPEFVISLKGRNAGRFGLSNLTFNETITYGSYLESRVVEDVGTVETQGTMLKFAESANLSYSGLPGIQSLNFGATYNQYQFDTGDQGFDLGFNSSLNTDWFTFLKTESSYNRTYSPEESNSPFVASRLGNLSNTDTETIREKLTFYYQNPSKYYSTFDMSYDLKARRKNDLTMGLGIIPNNVFKFDAKTTFRWTQNQYSDLQGVFNYTPNSDFGFTNSYYWDLNEGFLKQINETISMDLFKNSWLAHWKLELTFSYIRSQKDHHLSQLSFTKDLHCRTFSISWNKTNEEFRFAYSINAFESDKIEVIQDKTGKTDVKTKTLDTDGTSQGRY